MTSVSFSVTEVVTATRCPRQLVLLRRGHRVVPYGPDAFGSAAHVALHAMAKGAGDDESLQKLLSVPFPDRDAVERALFARALEPARLHAKKVASAVDGSDLGRFADTVKHIARLLTPALSKAAATADTGREAIGKVMLGTEDEVSVELEGFTIRGRIDLVHRDSPETWLWDLKTYAGSDHAQREQVRLYAMAYAARGMKTTPALVHVTRDRIEIDRADPPRDGDKAKLVVLLAHAQEWLGGAAPPPAPDLGTCRKCPAQSTCWRTWNRTLPDEVDEGRLPPVLEEPVVEVPSPLPTEPALPTVADEGFSSDDPAPLFLGTIPGKKPARVEPREIVRHMAIFGAAGSGKTVLAKTVVEEAILAGIPVIAFDVQGDILQLAQTKDDVPPELRARRDRYREQAEVRLLTPMSDAGLRLSLNPLKFPARDMPPEEAAVYSEAIADNLLAHMKLPPSWRNQALAYLAERIRAAMRKVDSMLIEDLIAGVQEDEGLDDLLLSKTQLDKLVKDLRLLTMGSKSFLFRVGRPLELNALVKPTTPGKTPLNIIWLNGLGDQQNKESFVAMVLTDLYGWMLKQRGGEPKVVLYFDEIGPYMPPNGEPASKRLLKRIFKEGRKYGVCGLFATQNFTDVDYKVVSQASTVAIGKLNAVQEKKKAADSLGNPPNFDVHGAVDKLIGSPPPGRFIMRRIEGPPHELQGRDLVTFHGGTWGEEEIRAHTTDAAREAWERSGT